MRMSRYEPSGFEFWSVFSAGGFVGLKMARRIYEQVCSAYGVACCFAALLDMTVFSAAAFFLDAASGGFCFEERNCE